MVFYNATPRPPALSCLSIIQTKMSVLAADSIVHAGRTVLHSNENVKYIFLMLAVPNFHLL